MSRGGLFLQSLSGKTDSPIRKNHEHLMNLSDGNVFIGDKKKFQLPTEMCFRIKIYLHLKGLQEYLAFLTVI